MIDVGRIVGVFGLQGHVKVEPITDFPERFKRGAKLWLDGEPRSIVNSHWHKVQVRVRLAGVDFAEQAEALVGKMLQIRDEDRPDLARDEFYVTELVGLDVRDESGKVVGKVEDVLPGAAQDLIAVRGALVPAVKEFVQEVNLEEGWVKIHFIPGMHPDDVQEDA